MDTERLRELVEQGEGPNLELQHSAPFAERLATVIAGFANATGGRILVGVDNSNTVVGAKPDRVRERLAEAARLVTPSLDLPVETLQIDGKDVLVITVPKGDESPYLANGEIVVRGHDRNQRITGTAIVDRVTQRSQSTAELTKEVKRLAAVVVTLNDEVITSRGWRPRIVDMVIGGIVGAVISLLLAAIVAALS